MEGFSAGYHGAREAQLQEQIRRQVIQEQAMKMQGAEAFGGAMQNMFVPGAMPMGPPPGQPMAPPPGMASQPRPRSPMNAGPSTSMAPRMPQGAPPAAPMAAPAPAAPTAAPAAPQPGDMSWQRIMGALKTASPQLPPAAVAAAIDRFEPLMQAEQKAEWQAERLRLQETLGVARLEHQQDLAVINNEARATRDASNNEARAEREDTRNRSREYMAAEKEKGLDKRHDERLTQERAKLEATVEKWRNGTGTATAAAAAIRGYQSAAAAKRAALVSRINADKVLDRAAKKVAIELADEAYQQAEADLDMFREAVKGGAMPAPQAPAAPATAAPPNGQPPSPTGGAAAKPLTPELKAKFDAGIAAQPGKKAAAIEALKKAGYDTSGL